MRFLLDKSAFARWLIPAVARVLDELDQRGLSIPGLVIAACAERHKATVLHYDGDFDMIATLTRHPSQWVVPPGSTT